MKVCLHRESHSWMDIRLEDGVFFTHVGQVILYSKDFPKPIGCLVGQLGPFVEFQAEIPERKFPVIMKKRADPPAMSLLKANGSRALIVNLDRLGLPYAIQYHLEFNERAGMVVSARVNVDFGGQFMSVANIVRDNFTALSHAEDLFQDELRVLLDRNLIMTLDGGMKAFESGVKKSRQRLREVLDLLEREKAYTLEDYYKEADKFKAYQALMEREKVGDVT